MLKTIKLHKQCPGAIKYIGKKYASGKAAWDEWGEKGLFESVKKQIGINLTDFYEDGDAVVGLMCKRINDEGKKKFEYWLGYFTPANTPVPEGLEYEDFPPMDMVTCQFYEKDGEGYDLACEALSNIEKAGYIVTTEWWFERYSPKRENIIDLGYFVE